MKKDAKIYVAGHTGLVGSAIMRKLTSAGYHNIVYKLQSELDLTVQSAVEEFFASEKPEYVFLSAAKVGGIKANSEHPAEFYYLNSMINNNVIHAAYRHKVAKLLFLGSSCIYPKLANQPIKESELLNGYLEPTNEAYAIAKIAGLKMCEYYRRQYGCDFISAMPCNMYGINDNFDLNSSHLLPALIRKFHEAKISNSPEYVLWGTGKPYREFLFSDDLADALLFLMNNYSDYEHVNVGSGTDQTILEIAQLVKSIVGYEGKIVHDFTKPDGMFRKVLDVNKINALGWQSQTTLSNGIKAVYDWYLGQNR